MITTLQQEPEQSIADLPQAMVPVELVDYDEYWPSTFRREKIRLLAGIGSWVQGIEHVGSTAIPKLQGRPSVDMMAGVRVLADADTFCSVPLQNLGFRYEPQAEKQLPQCRLFVRGSQMSRRCVQLFIVEKGGPVWRRLIGLRDYLRDHPDAVSEYATRKQSILSVSSDRERYQREKFAFIEELERRLQ